MQLLNILGVDAPVDFLTETGVVVGVEVNERDLWLALGVDKQLDEPELSDANDDVEAELALFSVLANLLKKTVVDHCQLAGNHEEQMSLIVSSIWGQDFRVLLSLTAS